MKAILLLGKLHSIHIFHKDCHLKNFMISEIDLLLIDYGQATKYKIKNDFNILYNDIFKLNLSSNQKTQLLDIVRPYTIKEDDPYLDDRSIRVVSPDPEIRAGFRRITKTNKNGAGRGGYIGRPDEEEDEDEDEKEDD